MKTYIFFLLLSLHLILLGGCDKDDGDISPSHADINWYVIQDNPSNPLDHLIYTIYASTGIPIFYKDTIGEENRGIDAFGKPFIYYEVLDISYEISSYTSKHFTLSDNQEDIRNGVELLRDSVIPYLPQGIAPKCFLLVEELNTGTYGEPTDVYKSLFTTAVGWVSKLKNSPGEERSYLAKTIVGTAIGSHLQAIAPKEIANFYAVSNSFIEEGRQIYKIYLEEDSPFTALPYKPWEEYGFLHPSPNSVGITTRGKRFYNITSEEQDLADFAGEIACTKESVFLQKYGQYDVIIKKYNIIKQLIENSTTKK